MNKVARSPAWLGRLKPLDLIALVLLTVGLAVMLWAGSLPADAAVFGLPSDTVFWSGFLLGDIICLVGSFLRALQGRPDGINLQALGQSLMWLGMALTPIAQLLHLRDHGTPRLAVPLVASAFLMVGLAAYVWGFYANVIRPARERRHHIGAT